MKKFFIILFLILSTLLLFGCYDGDENLEPNLSEQEFVDFVGIGLLNEGISGENIEAGSNKTIVTYTQLSSTSESEVYATWTHIFALTLEGYEKAGIEPEELIIICNFDDGEAMMITATPVNVKYFLNNQISTWDFVNSLQIDPLTRGPQIPE